MKRQSSISSWVISSKKAQEVSDKERDATSSDVAGSSRALLSPLLSDSSLPDSVTTQSVTTLDKDTSAESAGLHDSEAEESRRGWCEVFRKREEKVTRRYVRCKVCTSYPSVAAMHAHRQRTPPIATVGGTRYREDVIADHEKHACHEAAVRAKRQHELRVTHYLSHLLLV